MAKINSINNASASLVVDTTIQAGNDISTISGNFNMPTTGSGFTQGTLTLDSDPFLHGYGVNNTFVGLAAGNSTLSVDDAQNNNGVGVNALNGLTFGQGNDALGFQAGLVLTTGSDNQFIGFQAGGGLVDGVANTFIGFQSGINISDGGYNVMIGYQSGNNNISNDSSNIYINNLGNSGESNTVRIGTQGSSAGQQNVAYIAGIYGGSPSSPQMVTIDSSGLLGSQAIPSSSISITGDTGGTLTGSSFTFTGGTTGITFNGSGTTETLQITNLNLPATDSALDAGAITIDSTVIFQAFGVQNLFIGALCGNGTLNTGTAQLNLAVGNNSLPSLTDGNGNVAIGGSVAPSLTIGNLNNLFGLEAGFSLIDGSHNYLAGQQPGLFITSGSYNTMIGAYQAGSNCTSSESSNIYIQNAGVASESNTIRIGTTGSGNAQQSTAYIAGVYGVTPGGSGIQNVVMDSNGQLGTGSASGVSFSAYNASNPTGITGDGTLYTVAYDTTTANNGGAFDTSTFTFTAPVTGLYQFNVTVGVGALTALNTLGLIELVTTSRTYSSSYSNWGLSRASNNIFMASFSQLAPMSSGDTALVQVGVFNNATKNVALYGGDTNTAFSGYLVG